MSSINSEEIISILKEEIENFDMTAGVREVGNVIWVGDGIATVYGIDHAMYGEIVTFENGVKGMVQDIKKNEIGVIIFGKDTGIRDLANAEGIVVARDQARHSDVSTTNKYLKGSNMTVHEETKHFEGNF